MTRQLFLSFLLGYQDINHYQDIIIFRANKVFRVWVILYNGLENSILVYLIILPFATKSFMITVGKVK